MSDPRVVRIGAGSAAPFRTVREIWQYRDLFEALGTRDLRLRYRQTFLGVAWVILQPLAAAGIFAFVFGRIARVPTDGQPYVLFALAALIGWTFFSSVVTRASTSLIQNPQLVTRVYFPRLILPLAVLPAALVDLAVTLAVFAVLAVAQGHSFDVRLLGLPAAVMLLGALAVGAGFGAAALAVRYRDVQYLLPVGIQLALYASPVAYSASAVPPRWQSLYYANPLAAPIELMRWSLLGTPAPGWNALWYSTGVVALVVALGVMIFRGIERSFADEI
ncbi:MAG: ABC transporter permease [Gemmatimonadaceae bacterium]|nr:ABC transporter permease [Gemmatimonadaceae bacterium]